MVLKNNLENIALTNQLSVSSPRGLGYTLMGSFLCIASLNVSCFAVYGLYRIFEKYLTANL